MNKRVILEVLKFASIKDILQHYNVVSHVWHAISNEDELWYELHEGLSPVSNLPIKESLRLVLQRSLVLAVLLKDSIRIHDYSTGREKRVLLVGKGRFSWNSTHAFISKTKLLSSGYQFGEIAAECFVIDCNTGEITQVQSMNEARVGHGLITVQHYVYALGGYGLLKSCERWITDLSSPWQYLPNESLYPHSWATPTATSDFIYLCGGLTTACEQLNVSTFEFTMLSFQLPSADSGPQHTVEHNGYLLIVSMKYLHVCHLSTHRSEIVDYVWSEDVWSNAPALIYEGKIYSTRDEKNKFRALDIGKLTARHPLLIETLSK